MESENKIPGTAQLIGAAPVNFVPVMYGILNNATKVPMILLVSQETDSTL